MDPTATDQMNQPHIPISPNEMETNPKSSKNTLLTLASLLVLGGIVGITLFLYIQNKSADKNKLSQTPQQANPKAQPTIPTKLVAKNGPNPTAAPLICKRFKSIEDALKDPSIACILDLSGQKLTALPTNIGQLKKLDIIVAAKNNIDTFPSVLIGNEKLIGIDLSDNAITSIPKEITKDISLQRLNIKGNPIPDENIAEIKKLLPNLNIIK